MSAQFIPRLTPEQYLEIEGGAEFKSEYCRAARSHTRKSFSEEAINAPA